MPTPQEVNAQIAEERALELAERDAPVIEALLESKGWAYLSRRLRDYQTKVRNDIADGDHLTDAETRALRRVAREYETILAIPSNDLAVHRATIARANTK